MKIFFVLCLFFTAAFLCCGTSVPQGRVIILDGTSNSGKTTIAKPLLKRLGPSYVKVSLDDYVTDLWLEKRGPYLPPQEFVDRVHERVDAMYDTVKEHIAAGKNVLVDTVLSGLVGENDSKRCLEKLRGLSICMILVYCPLPVVMERMKQRNEQALLENNPGRFRPLIVSLKFGDIYRIALDTDIMLELLSCKDIEQMCQVSAQTSIEQMNILNHIKLLFLSLFDLHDKESVKITPRLVYDCIVDASMCSPEACAQKIYHCIK